jgi:hypothetical protein
MDALIEPSQPPEQVGLTNVAETAKGLGADTVTLADAVQLLESVTITE